MNQQLLKKIILTVLQVIVLLLVLWGSYYYGRNISMEQQLSLYDSLKNISAIIFGIIGAWIAVVYPEALQNLLDFSSHDRSVSQTFSKLLIVMSVSSLVLISSLMLEFVIPIARQVAFFVSYQNIFRGISYSFLAISTLVQAWCIGATLLPGINAEKKVKRIEKVREIDDKIMRRDGKTKGNRNLR